MPLRGVETRAGFGAGRADIFQSANANQDYFRLESQAERGFADAEFGALAEHGGADTLFFEEGAVGGVEVAEVDVVFADFDDAMVARDFGVLQSDVGAVAADDDARFFERVSVPTPGPEMMVRITFFACGSAALGSCMTSEDCEPPPLLPRAKDGRGEMATVAVGIFARVDDGRRGAARAAEFYFGVRADVGVFEHVLRAAVTAGCLHGDSKVAPRRRG